MEKTRFNLIFRKRGDLGIWLLVPGLIAVCFSRPLWNTAGLDDFILDAAGWLCLLAYMTFRLWATLYVGGLKDVQLQTQGPYSVCRNPLYFGSFCLGLSFAFFLESLTLLILGSIMTAIYTFKVVKIEEIFLEKKFGDTFRAYCRSTPRFIPNFRLHHSEDFIQVELRALQGEAKRLWGAALIPIALFFLMLLRTSSWWPHFFNLP